MKTLVLSEIFPPKTGGSGRWFFELYSRLPAEEYIIAAGTDKNAAKFDSKQNMNIIRLPLTMPEWGIKSVRGLKDYTRLFFAIRKIIKKERIDIIHCGRSLPEGFVCWMIYKFTRVPYICYVHGEELATYLHSKEFTLMTKLVFSAAIRVIVNSKNTEKLITDYQKSTKNKTAILNPGVDCGYFRQAKPDPKIKEKLGWKNRKVVLTAGRLQKRKGHDHAILAVKEIKKDIPGVLYAIVGDGEEMEYLKNLVITNNLDNYVMFMNELTDEDLLRCYQQCDVFLLANREYQGDIEGFGMVLVEAQACGKPVIAGNSGGTRETMIPDETGILVDCTKPELIAEAVVKLLNNPEKISDMGQKAVSWVKNNLDWQAHVKKAKILFSKLMG